MHEAIEEGAFFQMQTFKQALIGARRRGRDRHARQRRTPPRTSTTSSSRSSTRSRTSDATEREAVAAVAEETTAGRARSAGVGRSRHETAPTFACVLVVAARTDFGCGRGSRTGVRGRSLRARDGAARERRDAECLGGARPASRVSSPGANRPALPFPALQSLWQRAGATYGIPWQVLGAINKVESNFGQQHGPELGRRHRLDAVHALHLAALGHGRERRRRRRSVEPRRCDLRRRPLPRRGRRAHGHLARRSSPTTTRSGTWTRSSALRATTGRTASTSPSRTTGTRSTSRPLRRRSRRRTGVVVRATLTRRRLARREEAMYARADAAPLLSSRLALEKRAFQVGARRDAASASVAAAKRKLKAAEKALEQARASALTSSSRRWVRAPRRPALPGRLRLPGRRRALGRLGRPLPPRLSRCRHRGAGRLAALCADRRLHRRCVARRRTGTAGSA